MPTFQVTDICHISYHPSQGLSDCHRFPKAKTLLKFRVQICQGSVSKPEIQPLVPLFFRCPEVVFSVLQGHRIPNSRARLIPPHIVALNKDSHDNVPANDGKKDLIPPPIEGFIVFAVNLARENH